MERVKRIPWVRMQNAQVVEQQQQWKRNVNSLWWFVSVLSFESFTLALSLYLSVCLSCHCQWDTPCARFDNCEQVNTAGGIQWPWATNATATTTATRVTTGCTACLVGWVLKTCKKKKVFIILCKFQSFFIIYLLFKKIFWFYVCFINISFWAY